MIASERVPSGRPVAIGVAALLSSLVVQNIGAALAKLIFPLVGALGVTAIRIALSALLLAALLRPWRRRVISDERRAGQEWCSTCRSGWYAVYSQQKIQH